MRHRPWPGAGGPPAPERAGWTRRKALAGLGAGVTAALPRPGRAGSFGFSEFPATPVAPTAAQLDRAIAAAGGYLLRQLKPDGSFIYQLNVDPEIGVPEAYNWLRHAGTAYAMGLLAGRTGDAEMAGAAARAVDRMRAVALGPCDIAEGALTIWSDPAVTGVGSTLTAKLGGPGLALMAMGALERVRPGAVPLAEMRGLGRFIVAMQQPGGRFFVEYAPEEDGARGWASLYYPGEAALGLVELYDRDPEALWLDTATAGIRYLAESFSAEAEMPDDHWTLIATGRLWPYLGAGDRALLLANARRLTEQFLADQVWEDSVALGGFSPWGGTSSAATRLEGFLAVEPLFRDDPAFHGRIRRAMGWGMAFLLRAQVRTGPYAGAVPGGISTVHAAHPRAESFNARATEVRIDHVQHALSAFMGYRDLLG